MGLWEFGVMREFLDGAVYLFLLGSLGESSGRGRDGGDGGSSGNSGKTIPLSISLCGCTNSSLLHPLGAFLSLSSIPSTTPFSLLFFFSLLSITITVLLSTLPLFLLPLNLLARNAPRNESIGPAVLNPNFNTPK